MYIIGTSIPVQMQQIPDTMIDRIHPAWLTRLFPDLRQVDDRAGGSTQGVGINSSISAAPNFQKNSENGLENGLDN